MEACGDDWELQGGMIDRWKRQAKRLKGLVYTLYFAYRDPRTPWYARVVAACVVGYAFSPIDLIPDPIPVLGYLDDLILIPLGVALAVRLMPSAVWIDAQAQSADALGENRPVNWAVAAVIVALWIALAVVGSVIVWRWWS